ncbi:MAG: hypothetical protein HY747_03370 [Elusimicrobia bacterium]|nr:hypothetical protein [Elusimicrobiota bacterium]
MLLDVYAKNWLAHDGCWFLAIEEKFGLETAIELDAAAWERFSPIEAKRIMAAFNIPANNGLKALAKALPLRLAAGANTAKLEWQGPDKIIYSVVECRVQKARRLKKLPDFPCKKVGLIEYEKFAQTIDPRIQTKCLRCPPDPAAGSYCQWEFKLK